ncbi:GntR family transcriptional regulator [Cupriavidus oxalaticus]|jgi:GntR family transcriptional regulator|uniref:GntR family transcriptional regulator n=1 Tax=Cupriavidus oxalaticus TaxID=96344 RepID=A0A375FQH9_9BURK|nr:GntR family transcriptional regulator [Cupriavidus oxalaticus]QRQ85441.1 GntR family transcriptional regulator [Cupriavidus oxalaticus]QRQ90471.1 GntR family transcriptional regulator [Cupriavidus oxalaticus]WQD84989.1 GntR family transcriptional regulator [Cupriavidus oxalaticus]SPC08333.1 GntR family transcriptional regulator [Cupriavidus oxalaticus]SPC24240.1 GntR family transcriptional regulator [Cupriavidus oxalaticus]
MTRATTAGPAAADSAVLPDDNAGGVTRYRQLASVLRHKIVAGEYPVGFQLPTVEQLAQAYGIAKVTVRQAYALLTEEGLITSQRGRGTHVIMVPSGPGEGMRSAINDVAVGPNALEIRILEKRREARLPPGLAGSGVPMEGGYVMLRKLHVHDGMPFCLIELYVAATVFASFPRGGEKHHKIAHLLRQSQGERLGMMRQTMTVEPADAVLARELDYAFAAPVARIVRTTLDIDGNVLTAGVFWYRGDRFILDVEMPARLTERYPDLAIPKSAARPDHQNGDLA